MTVIRIQERAIEQDGANAILSFENGPEYPISIRDPYSPKEEAQLEWYFEEHLRFPFIKQIEANNAAKSLQRYGESLFQQVFGTPESYALYRDCLKEGLNKTVVEIAGSAEFHRLHWEALKDPKFDVPLAPQTTIVRRNIVPQTLPASIRSSPTINVLIVTARPFGKRDVGYRTISRPLVEDLRQANLRVKIELIRPGTYKALENHLRETTNHYGVGYYHVIHFDVHGSVLTYEQFEHIDKEQKKRANRYQYAALYGRPAVAPYQGRTAFLFFEGEQDNEADPVEAHALANLLQSHQVPIAILNACQSGKQVGDRESSLGNILVQAGVQFVLAMGYSVTVSAAELMMHTLYSKLFASNDLPTVIRDARQELFNNKERRAYFNQHIDLEDWVLPVVYQNQVPRFQIRDFTVEERKAHYVHETERYPAPKTTYAFVGRDLDILHLEKMLLTRRNIALIRGMGGAGKTTLLHHLGYWWQTTGLIDQVFYFGYDQQTWTRQQILVAIAQKLLPDPIDYVTQFQVLPTLEAQQAMLTQLLRTKRHLLVLDNLESITGTSFAIQHILSADEQAALHSLLMDLVDGRTLVLLGSRSGETWLAEGTFNENVLELGGLDPEAASTLTDLILKRQQVEKYRRDTDLQQLVRLLDGFPLALEVVLANLKRQTPKEILEVLQSGGIKLDVGSSQEKTQNILRCIEYSHSNLSLEAQQLLTCLAPFTSVFFLGGLDQYTSHLKQQAELATLPFERWQEVIQEAINWGLLTPDSNISGFLRLQPVLPYFLRTRLQVPDQAEVLLAIERAFRQHYEQLSNQLYRLLQSKDAQEQQVGQVLAGLEYENLMRALNLALTAHLSILFIYAVLSTHLDKSQDQRRDLELGQAVLESLNAYPAEKLTGQLAAEFIGVVDVIARRQSKLKQHGAAEESYRKALALSIALEDFNKELSKKMQASTYHNLGIVAQAQRQWEQAEQYYQQALQIYIDFNDRYEQASTYHQLGRVAQEQRQWEQAEQYYQQALQIYIDFNDRYSQASTYHNLGIVAQAQRQWEQAEQYYQQALQIYIDFNDRYEQAGTYHQLGIVAQAQRQWEQAEQYYQQALQIKIDFNDRYEQASTYHQLGRVAQEQRQWEQAEQYYQQTLQIYIDFNDRYSQASTYHNLGIVAQAQRQWEQAEQYYQQALQIYIDFNDRYEQASTYHQLGIVAQEQRQWEQAEQYYQQALQIKIDFNDRYSQASTYHNLGIVAQEQRQWEQAEQYYQQALQIYIDFNDRYSQASTYHQLGIVAQAQRQWDKAREAFLQALKIFVTYKDTHSSSIVLHSLSKLWETTGEKEVPTAIALILECTLDDAEAVLRQMLEDKD